jgi:hypothetical protein
MEFVDASILSFRRRNFNTDKQSGGSRFFSTDTNTSCDEELKQKQFSNSGSSHQNIENYLTIILHKILLNSKAFILSAFRHL